MHVEQAIGAAEHIVLVLVDGLGMHLIDRLPRDEFLRAHLAVEMRSVFPSSTAPALTSLASGLWPAEHGVLGWWQYLARRDISITTLPFIERWRERPLLELGVDETEVFPAPVLPPRFQVDAEAWIPEWISGSVATRYFNGRGGRPYRHVSNAVGEIGERIARAKQRTYTYFYVPFVDTEQHAHGPYSLQAELALRRVSARLETLAAAIRGRARLIVTADHGQTLVPSGGSHVIGPDHALSSMLVAPPSGEPRAALFHCRPGESDRFARAFEAALGERFSLLNRADVESLELLGALKLGETARSRFGDFIAIPRGADIITATPPEFIGTHGGLSPEEMRIPLIAM